MRNLRELAEYRDHPSDVLMGSVGAANCGVFRVPYPRTGALLLVLASTDLGWDHVSVSLKHRTPNWYEMEFIKRMFFEADETAMQLHVPTKEHLCLADTCLHLWRPLNCEIPRPDPALVGTKGLKQP